MKRADQRRPLARTERSGSALSGDFMKGRVGDLVRVHFGGPVNHFRQILEHLGIGVAAVLLRALLAVPQADGNRVLAAGAQERDLVLEAVLLAQTGRISFSKVLVNSLAVLGLRWSETLRAYIWRPGFIADLICPSENWDHCGLDSRGFRESQHRYRYCSCQVNHADCQNTGIRLTISGYVEPARGGQTWTCHS